MAFFYRKFLILVIIFFFINEIQGQQVQTGHYAPGWNGKLKAGMMAEDPGLYLMNTTMFFHAQKFRDGSGEIASTGETDYILNALAIAWRPDFKLFGADYQAVVTPSVGNLSGRPVMVDGQPQKAAVGFSDMFFAPMVLGWHWPEYSMSAAISGFAPTGRYSFGSTDNTGLGFWTIMPFTMATYRTQRGVFDKTPLLLTGGIFYEIHTNQEGRDFRPGDSFTFEWNVGLELARQTALGVSGYIYRQVTDPQGSDAEPVDKYQSNGLGITLSQGLGPINVDFRIFQDFGVKNGPEGTLIYLDIAWGWITKK